MANKMIAKGTKDKKVTFRVTDKLSDELAELKVKCAQHGIRINVSEALSAALEREIKATQKHIQSIDPSWEPGQLSLEELETK